MSRLPEPGEKVGGAYLVERLLKSGRSGAVFEATRVDDGLHCALKLIHPGIFARHSNLRERFEAEVQVGTKLGSKHVVEVFGAGVDALFGPWLAMERLDGATLTEWVGRPEGRAGAGVMPLLAQICEALGAAHRLGVVHGDLRPENVFVLRAASPQAPPVLKVLNFGLARLLQETRTPLGPSGSRSWFAPEQATGPAKIDADTDVWAVGLIAFFLFTGRSYWRSYSDDLAADVRPYLHELGISPVPATQRAQELHLAPIPREFDWWFAKCVAKQRGARFQNASRAFEALEKRLASVRDRPLEPTSAARSIARPAPALEESARVEPVARTSLEPPLNDGPSQRPSATPLVSNRVLLGSVLLGVGIGSFLTLVLVPTLTVRTIGPKGEAVAGVQVLLDGRPFCRTPCPKTTVAEGTHTITIVAGESLEDSAALVVQARAGHEVGLNIPVRVREGSIRVRVDCPTRFKFDFPVMIDGKDSGIAGELRPISPGRHALKILGNEWCESAELEVLVSSGSVAEASQRLKLLQHTLTLIPGENSDDAQVVVKAEQRQWSIPSLPCSLDLPAHDHYSIVATRPGFADVEEIVTLEDGQPERMYSIDFLQRLTVAQARTTARKRSVPEEAGRRGAESNEEEEARADAPRVTRQELEAAISAKVRDVATLCWARQQRGRRENSTDVSMPLVLQVAARGQGAQIRSLGETDKHPSLAGCLVVMVAGSTFPEGSEGLEVTVPIAFRGDPEVPAEQRTQAASQDRSR